jgi:hypothetical protein
MEKMNYKINPDKCTCFYLDKHGLELHILFWIFAAGKNGHTASKCLNNILEEHSVKTGITGPFDIIQTIENLPQELKKFGVGCFNNKAKTIKFLIEKELDLSTCTIEQLEDVWGLGPKSVRCFLIHTRENQELAGLDRHDIYLNWVIKFQNLHQIKNNTWKLKKYLLNYLKKWERQ